MCQVLNFQHGTSVFWISDREEVAVGKEADLVLVKRDIVAVLSDARHLCCQLRECGEGLSQQLCMSKVYPSLAA
jgi:hypothetical protein